MLSCRFVTSSNIYVLLAELLCIRPIALTWLLKMGFSPNICFSLLMKLISEKSVFNKTVLTCSNITTCQFFYCAIVHNIISMVSNDNWCTDNCFYELHKLSEMLRFIKCQKYIRISNCPKLKYERNHNM